MTVEVQDAYGNVLTADATDQVTLAIAANAAGGTLGGTTTATAVAGVATFGNLSINEAGTGYTLAATSGKLAKATSAAFNVKAVPRGLRLDGDRRLQPEEMKSYRGRLPELTRFCIRNEARRHFHAKGGKPQSTLPVRLRRHLSWRFCPPSCPDSLPRIVKGEGGEEGEKVPEEKRCQRRMALSALLRRNSARSGL